MSGTETFSGGFPPLDLNNTVGAILVGGLVTAVLYGITLLQTVTYYQHSQQDSWLFKAVVFLLWALDTFDMVLIGHISYFYMVVNYGKPAALATPVWSIEIHLLVTAVTEFVVRTMFTLRVWKLSQEKYIPVAIISIISLADLALGITVTVTSLGKTFAQLGQIEGFIFAEFGTSLASDLLVVIFLCYYLHKSRTGMSGTETVITILTGYVIETGLLTVIALSVNIVLFAVKPNNFAFVAVYFVISKLYANAYLAMLNVRGHIREKSHLSGSNTNFHGSQSDSPSGLGLKPANRIPPPRPVRYSRHEMRISTPLSIQVHTEFDHEYLTDKSSFEV